jgi:hypothetical protein
LPWSARYSPYGIWVALFGSALRIVGGARKLNTFGGEK